MAHTWPVDNSRILPPPPRPLLREDLYSRSSIPKCAPSKRPRQAVPLRLQTDVRIPPARLSSQETSPDATRARVGPRAKGKARLAMQTRIPPLHNHTQSLPVTKSPEMIELKGRKGWPAWTVPGVGLSPACLLEKKLDEVGILLHESDGESGDHGEYPKGHLSGEEIEVLEGRPVNQNCYDGNVPASVLPTQSEYISAHKSQWHTEPSPEKYRKELENSTDPRSRSPMQRQQHFWQNVFKEPATGADSSTVGTVSFAKASGVAKPDEELDYFSIQPSDKDIVQTRIPPLPWSSAKSSPTSASNSVTTTFSNQSSLAFFGRFKLPSDVRNTSGLKSSDGSPQEGWWDVLRSPFFTVTPVSLVVTPTSVTIRTPSPRRMEVSKEDGGYRNGWPWWQVSQSVAQEKLDISAFPPPRKPPPLPPRAATTITHPAAAASSSSIPLDHHQKTLRRPQLQMQQSASAAAHDTLSSFPIPPRHKPPPLPLSPLAKSKAALTPPIASSALIRTALALTNRCQSQQHCNSNLESQRKRDLTPRKKPKLRKVLTWRGKVAVAEESSSDDDDDWSFKCRGLSPSEDVENNIVSLDPLPASNVRRVPEVIEAGNAGWKVSRPVPEHKVKQKDEGKQLRRMLTVKELRDGQQSWRTNGEAGDGDGTVIVRRPGTTTERARLRRWMTDLWH